LGEKRVPTTAYYGIQTLRAVENFPVSGIKTHSALVRAYMQLKKAAVLANIEVGRLYPTIGHAIVTACDDVLSGKYADQFIVDAFQAGAGTSFNMNCNEVLANRALELLGKQKGDYASVGPNDHVNMAQSSNDTFPTALHIALLSSLAELLPILKEFANAFFKKAEEFKAYASAITRATQQLHEQSKQLNALALGGTAVGTGANTHPDYQHFAIKNLCEITGLDLTAASDLHEALQSRLAIASVSGALKALALEIIRIANDLRLLSSGPTTGLAEIELPPVQPGSSIMPGKINPSMAECLNMIAFQIVGNDVTISMAVQAGQLDLNVMTPVMAHNALQSIDLLKNYLPIFIEKCIYGIKVNRERCEAYLVHNPSLATFLSPHIGYLEAGKLAKEALEKNMSIKDLVLAKNLLTEEEAERIFNAEFLVGAKK
jgi:aspartate ammonia-lyase